MSVWLDLSHVSRRCSRGHEQGKWTKQSAIYPDALAKAVAEGHASAINERLGSLEQFDIDTPGLEPVWVNDLASSQAWELEKVWDWCRPVHINLLETSCVYRLLTRLAHGPTPLIAAISLGFGLYPHLPFCPTRLMPADHPTRSAPIPAPSASGLDSSWSAEEKRSLASMPKLRRWAANWVRLLLLLAHYKPPSGCLYRDRDRSFSTFVPPAMGFDSTLGFPGEGP